MKREFLSIDTGSAELRAADDGQRKLIGYASKYGSYYPVGDFLERIDAGAFDDVLSDATTDVVASMNHDVNFTFARQSAGTLRLRSNSVGLQYEADVTDDHGAMIWQKVAAGTIQGSSFMFSVKPEVDDSWEFPAGGIPRRTIHRVRNLYELGPVVWPANSEATVKARADEILAEARAAYGLAGMPSSPAEPPSNAEIDQLWQTIDAIRAFTELPDA